MKEIRKSQILGISILLSALFVGMLPASARVWSKNPIALAQDYAVINDNRGNGDLVLIFWVAAPILADGPATDAARSLLDKNVLIGVVHAHFAKDGTVTFDQVSTLDVADGAGAPLKLLDTNAMSPAVVGTMAMTQNLFARSLGQLGQGTHWFVFDAGAIRACAPGALAINFSGEKYIYDTPFPGCR